jgi:hypothetical protein
MKEGSLFCFVLEILNTLNRDVSDCVLGVFGKLLTRKGAWAWFPCNQKEKGRKKISWSQNTHSRHTNFVKQFIQLTSLGLPIRQCYNPLVLLSCQNKCCIPRWISNGTYLSISYSLFDALPTPFIDSNVNLRWKQQKSKELGHIPWLETL